MMGPGGASIDGSANKLTSRAACGQRLDASAAGRCMTKALLQNSGLRLTQDVSVRATCGGVNARAAASTPARACQVEVHVQMPVAGTKRTTSGRMSSSGPLATPGNGIVAADPAVPSIWNVR